MASVYDLKPAFQRGLRPIARRLAAAGVSANQVTLAGVLLSAAAGLAVALWPQARWPLLVLPAALFVRLALNALDGMLAREHGLKSPLGAILNELGDVVSDAVLYLPLALVPGVAAGLVVAAVLLAVIAEMAGVVAVQIGAERRYDGPMGKSDRALAFGAVALALGLGIAPGIWLDGVLGIIVLLLCLTIWNRARRALGRMSR
ncbi:MAG TPA: CDP-alcohol phosphatidyltransferase family protein [Dongiaceae bacterium]|nr:CDP-alcohol phosphatidyltransferase family protein [Dongiaceae bacterium]